MDEEDIGRKTHVDIEDCVCACVCVCVCVWFSSRNVIPEVTLAC